MRKMAAWAKWCGTVGTQRKALEASTGKDLELCMQPWSTECDCTPSVWTSPVGSEKQASP